MNNKSIKKKMPIICHYQYYKYNFYFYSSKSNIMFRTLLVCKFSTSVIPVFSQLQLKLIKHSLPHVHKYGWSDNAIHAACADLELSPAAHRIIKPYDMISYCMNNWNQQALRKIDDYNFESRTKIRDKVWYAIKERLILELEYIDTWNQAMAIGSHPSNISQTKDLLWEYSDEIWRRCGDTATDYNYYTKRILFNSAYATTELHLLTDQSQNKEESWKFLERRIEDILKVGKGVSDLKTVAGAAFDGILNIASSLREPPARQIRNPIFQRKFNEFSTKAQSVSQPQQQMRQESEKGVENRSG